MNKYKAVIPAIYARSFLKTAAKAGLSEREILQGLDFKLPDTRLSGNFARLSLAQYEALTLRILALGQAQKVDMEGAGYATGLRISMSTHGLLAQIVLSQLTIGRALETAIRFRALVLPFVHVDLTTEGAQTLINLRFDADLSDALRQPFIELVIAAIWRTLAGIMGRARRDITLDFMHAEPPYHDRFRAQLPSCRFNAGAYRVRLPTAYLSRRIMTGDTLIADLLEESGTRTLALMDDRTDIVQRVRSLLNSEHGYPALEQVCDRLAVSPRTLKRRLLAQGTSFLALQEECRLAEAKSLLRRPEHPVSHIAERLGYSDPANFTNAFRKWTGMTPSAWRSSPTS